MSICTVGVTAALAVASARGGDEQRATVLVWAETVGSGVLGHIGWGFGVFIPTLLGLYGIVIGGQAIATPATAVRIRRGLGLVAEVMAAAFVPALLLVFIACVGSPERVGALFVVLPVSGVLLFLAIQLGGFVVFERHQQLAAAKTSRTWARERLRTLRYRSRRAPWLVFLANVLVASTIGLIATLPSTRDLPGWGVFAIFAVLAALLVFFGAYARFISSTASDRASGVLIWCIAGLVFAAIAVAAGGLTMSTPPSIGGAAGMGTLVAFLGVSTLWPRGRAPRLREWTLHGAAASCAARSVCRTYRRAVREIHELTPRALCVPAVPLVERMNQRFREWRSATSRTVDLRPTSGCCRCTCAAQMPSHG